MTSDKVDCYFSPWQACTLTISSSTVVASSFKGHLRGDWRKGVFTLTPSIFSDSYGCIPSPKVIIKWSSEGWIDRGQNVFFSCCFLVAFLVLFLLLPNQPFSLLPYTPFSVTVCNLLPDWIHRCKLKDKNRCHRMKEKTVPASFYKNRNDHQEFIKMECHVEERDK